MNDASGKEAFGKKFNRKALIEFVHQLPITLTTFDACCGSALVGAAAIAEAAIRASMRFVTVQPEHAQTMAAMHRIRNAFVKERAVTMLRVGSILLEFGISLP